MVFASWDFITETPSKYVKTMSPSAAMSFCKTWTVCFYLSKVFVPCKFCGKIIALLRFGLKWHSITFELWSPNLSCPKQLNGSQDYQLAKWNNLYHQLAFTRYYIKMRWQLLHQRKICRLEKMYAYIILTRLGRRRHSSKRLNCCNHRVSKVS